MEIKPNWIRWFSFAGIMIAAFVLYIYLAKDIWIQGELIDKVLIVMILFPIIWFVLTDFIVTCRKIKLDEKGCTIKILNYERFYRWEDFAVKRKEGKYWFIIPSRYVASYVPRKGVFFSLRYMDKIKNKDPYNFCLLHPFSCFYIYLIDDMKKHGREKSLRVFCEADEKKFLQNIEKWGVELEEDL